MAAGNTPTHPRALSEYSSFYTESAESTASASEEEPCEVLIFYHDISNMKTPVNEAERILRDKKLTVNDSTQISFEAGRAKTDIFVAYAKSSKYKIFVVNKSFAKHDLAFCRCILDNPKICTSENTLLLCRTVHKKLIPDDLAHFTTHSLSSRIDGNEIAEKIISFKDEHNVINTQPLEKIRFSAGEDQKLLEYESKRTLFLDMVDRFDRRRIFFLCTCVRPVDRKIPYQSLSRVKWIKIFDFDGLSEEDGLLSMVKNSLEKGRFAITSTKDTAQKLHEKISDWTIVQSNDSDEQHTDFLAEHISSTSLFCIGQKPATIIVLWYQKARSDELLEENMAEFISNINYEFKPPREIKIVLCLAEIPEDRTDLAKISKRYAKDNRIIAPMEKICEWLMEISPARPDTEIKLTLPKLKEDDAEDAIFSLDEEVINWLKLDMEVLSCLPAASKPNVGNIIKRGEDYLKGGDITWEVIEDGSFDVPRDITQEITEYLSVHHIKKGVSGIVTLLHSPGSGGTTVARRVVWGLRSKVPCLILEKKTEIQDDFKEKIKFVRDKSNLPVLMLVDGRSSQEVRNILDMCRYERVVIFHVIRYYAPIEKRKSGKGNFFLADSLSKKEAPLFQQKLVKCGNAGIKKRMADLTKDIQNGKTHSVFEYGLTAFHSEFRGVGKYVESHLCLKHETENWHRVAAFLSLANYYGNCGLPAEFFALILRKSRYDIVDLQSDIPEWGQQLIRECDNCDWKISHFFVAKEILEQYLSKNISESNTEKLSFAACRKLHSLAADFLKCAKGHMGTRQALRDDFTAILNGIFIMRYDKDEYDDDEYKKKSDYSRMITNIQEEKQQRAIFQTLVEHFPTNAEFHAHFGRFLAKTNHHKEAVEVLKKAVFIRCTALENAGKDPSINGDEVLHRIHSMFGFAYNWHVRHIFGNCGVGFMFASNSSKTSTIDIEEACSSATRAIDEFKKCRGYYCPSASRTYGYIGEIQARLHITEFCFKRTGYDLNSVADEGNPLHFLWGFIRESFVECDFLLDQCMAMAGDTQRVYKEMDKFLNLFQDYYRAVTYRLSKWAGDGKTFWSKRSRVTLLKTRVKKQKREFRVFEDLSSARDACNFLHLLENVLDDRQCRQIKMSPYMEDWIKVIRSPYLSEPCPLATVCERVDIWDSQKERESFSTFYKFVVQFMITMLSSTTPANLATLEEYRIRLNESQRSLRQKIVEKPIEWIKIITAENKNTMSMLAHWQEGVCDLQTFTGRIVVAKAWSGQIELTGTKLSVFFVPQKFGVRGFHAKERRLVGFEIGFNVKHGAQAYRVCLLKKFECGYCGTTLEAPSLPPTCQCCRASSECFFQTK